MRTRVAVVLASLATASAVQAQSWKPAGIALASAQRATDRVTGGAPPLWAPPPTRRAAQKWIVTGGAIGAVVGGTYAVAQVARGGHDALATAFSPIFVALGVGAGALGGGVVGGIAYAITHPGSLTTSPNDR